MLPYVRLTVKNMQQIFRNDERNIKFYHVVAALMILDLQIGIWKQQIQCSNCINKMKLEQTELHFKTQLQCMKYIGVRTVFKRNCRSSHFSSLACYHDFNVHDKLSIFDKEYCLDINYGNAVYFNQSKNAKNQPRPSK